VHKFPAFLLKMKITFLENEYNLNQNIFPDFLSL